MRRKGGGPAEGRYKNHCHCGEAPGTHPQAACRVGELGQGDARLSHGVCLHAIKAYVPQALRAVPVLVTAEEGDGRPIGFMGIAGHRLEMLFVAADMRGRGVGRALWEYGMERFGVNELTVNEQNPQAAGFYGHMGFRAYRLAERDEQGNPYPLLYMKKA